MDHRPDCRHADAADYTWLAIGTLLRTQNRTTLNLKDILAPENLSLGTLSPKTEGPKTLSLCKDHVRTKPQGRAGYKIRAATRVSPPLSMWQKCSQGRRFSVGGSEFRFCSGCFAASETNAAFQGQSLWLLQLLLNIRETVFGTTEGTGLLLVLQHPEILKLQ